jgi:OPA family phosphoglycerate-like MFS transporter
MAGAIWNISHNVGGGIVAPIVGVGFALFTTAHWQTATYQVPAVVAILLSLVILALCKGSPVSEGLPPLNEIVKEDAPAQKTVAAPDNMSAWQIFRTYVLPNKNAWFVSLVDTFVYMIRFGMISWLPIYLLEVKHFSKAEMSIAFLVFEWAAIPSTLFAGYLSDKFFKGYRMPPAIISMVLIFFCLIGYWQSTSLFAITIFAAAVGCLIYIPQFLASVQTMEVVPPFAVGSAVGLRGFMSYILGASMGTSLFGFMVDRVGWNGGFYVLLGGVICCIIFCILTHRGAKQLEIERQNQERLSA